MRIAVAADELTGVAEDDRANVTHLSEVEHGS